MNTRGKSGFILGLIFMLMVTPIALLVDSELLNSYLFSAFFLIRLFSPVNVLMFLQCFEITTGTLNFGMYISFFLFGVILGWIMNSLPKFSRKYVLMVVLSFVIALVFVLVFMVYFVDKSPCDFSFSQACCASKNK
jgi:uncharacterized membrane protein